MSPFLGKPILSHIVNLIKKLNTNSTIILATSEEKSDDPLAAYGKHLGIEVVRGPLDDVLERFLLALKKYKCDAFFRVCGDSPLLLKPLFKKAVSIYKNNSYDLVTNVFPRTFPIGMSMELIDRKIFLETEIKIKKKIDREHITKYFYKNSKEYRIFNIKCAKYIKPGFKLAIDEVKDLQRLEKWFLKKGSQYDNFFPIKSIK
tara:strand:- start:31290 stop:31898 length:609 start_codon:yes stop_codon:yes gene_type:complete